MIRAAAYIRVSTTRQAEEGVSLGDQLRSIEERVRQLGGEVSEVFSDSGSGTDDKRPEFRRLLALARSVDRPFDLVVVHSTSRLARNVVLSESSIRELEHLGVKFLSVTQDVQEPLTRVIHAAVDEHYSRQNSLRVGETMMANAAEGFWNGGPAPYGYRTVTKEKRGKKEKKVLETDEVEATIVRQMFDLCLKGDGQSGPMGVKSICNELNSRGNKTRNGNLWQLSTVHAKLTSTYYVGYYEQTRGTVSKTRSDQDGKKVRIECPRIVDQPIYDAVQSKLKRDNPLNSAPRKASADHLLTGIAVCENCGRGLTLTTGKSGRYRYYSCRGALTAGQTACSQPTRVPVDELDDLVTRAIVEKVIEENHLQDLLNGLIERHSKANSSAEQDALRREKEALDAKRGYENLLTLVERGLVDTDDEDFSARLDAVKTKRNIANEAAKRARLRINNKIAITPEMVVKFSDIMRQGLTRGNTKFRRSYIAALVERVNILPNRVAIRGKSSDLISSVQADNNDGEVPSRIQEWRTRRDSNS